jgi:hypothetical protein
MKLKKGEIMAQHSGPASVTKGCNKKIVTMIATYHSHNTRTVTIRGKEVVKPVSVLDYNKSMIGDDLKDQLLHFYLIETKRMNKWYTKLFHRLLNTSILNAMIIYRNKTGKIIDQLTEGLFVKYANAVEHTVPGRHSSDNTVPHLTARHFISRIAPTAKKSRLQKGCVVCHKRGKDTVYWCHVCGVGLCIECFCNYHTQLNF